MVAALTETGCAASTPVDAGPLRVGAVYPLPSDQGDGREQADGVLLAADLVNKQGGVRGRQVQVLVKAAPDAAAATRAVDDLVTQGVEVILGTSGTAQSLPASAEASRRGPTFLETGAIADAITSRGLPGVLRTGVDATTIGQNAAQFVNDFILPGAALYPTGRIVILFEDDAYGSSVAYSSIERASGLKLNVVDSIGYDPNTTDFQAVAARIAADHPDVIIAAPYAQDAVGVRQAMVQQHVHVTTIIGASSAYSGPTFGAALGQDAVGLFASDKSDGGITGDGLTPQGRDLLYTANAMYVTKYARAMSGFAMAGFVGGWVMFHEILPKAISASRGDVSRAAMSIDLPEGSEINGSGVKFADASAPNAGQNTRAIGVIWEWIGAGQRAIVYPPAYAKAQPQLLPVSG